MGRDRRKQREYDRRWRRAHPERARAATRRWQQKNPHKLREASLRQQRENPDYWRQYRQQLRAEVLRLLGGSCARCGYDGDPRGLEIDHIDGDRNGTSNRMAMLRARRDPAYRATLQLLCGTCHRIKTIENEDWRTADPAPTPNDSQLALWEHDDA